MAKPSLSSLALSPALYMVEYNSPRSITSSPDSVAHSILLAVTIPDSIDNWRSPLQQSPSFKQIYVIRGIFRFLSPFSFFIPRHLLLLIVVIAPTVARDLFLFYSTTSFIALDVPLKITTFLNFNY